MCCLPNSKSGMQVNIWGGALSAPLILLAAVQSPHSYPGRRGLPPSPPASQAHSWCHFHKPLALFFFLHNGTLSHTGPSLYGRGDPREGAGREAGLEESQWQRTSGTRAGSKAHPQPAPYIHKQELGGADPLLHVPSLQCGIRSLMGACASDPVPPPPEGMCARDGIKLCS